MKMKKIFLHLFSLVLLVTGCDHLPQFHVEGQINDAEGKTLFFEALSIEGVQALDSLTLDHQGRFSFYAPAPSSPEFYALRIDRTSITLAIDSTETVSVTASYPTMATGYTVKGSEESARISRINAAQHELEQKIVEIESNNTMFPADITDSVKTVLNAYKEKMKNDYIFAKPQAASAYYAVCQAITDRFGAFLLFDPMDDRNDVKCYATVATAWDGHYPEAARTIQLCNNAIKGMDNTAPVRERELRIDESKISETGIIEINLPDVSGREHRLTSLKGKVVLVDFTRYDAQNSGARILALRQLYDKYASQGLEIYQVSEDEDMSFWRYSAENLPWICVHETDGRTTGTYGITVLPTSFIVNRDNEIVMRCDQGVDIESEIASLL